MNFLRGYFKENQTVTPETYVDALRDDNIRWISNDVKNNWKEAVKKISTNSVEENKDFIKKNLLLLDKKSDSYYESSVVTAGCLIYNEFTKKVVTVFDLLVDANLTHKDILDIFLSVSKMNVNSNYETLLVTLIISMVNSGEPRKKVAEDLKELLLKANFNTLNPMLIIGNCESILRNYEESHGITSDEEGKIKFKYGFPLAEIILRVYFELEDIRRFNKSFKVYKSQLVSTYFRVAAKEELEKESIQELKKLYPKEMSEFFSKSATNINPLDRLENNFDYASKIILGLGRERVHYYGSRTNNEKAVLDCFSADSDRTFKIIAKVLNGSLKTNTNKCRNILQSVVRSLTYILRDLDISVYTVTPYLNDKLKSMLLEISV